MHEEAALRKQPIAMDTLVARHGGTALLRVMTFSRAEHHLPVGAFDQLTQILVNREEVKGDQAPTARQRKLLGDYGDFALSDQGTALRLIGAVLDRHVEIVEGQCTEESEEPDRYAPAPASPYSVGAHVLLWALSESTNVGEQSRALFAFHDAAADFDFPAWLDTLARERQERLLNGRNSLEVKHDADSQREKAWRACFQSDEGVELLKEMQNERDDVLPGHFTDLANAIINQGAVDRIGEPLDKMLRTLSIETSDPHEAFRYFAALQDIYMNATRAGGGVRQRAVMAQTYLLFNMSIGLSARQGARILGTSAGYDSYRILLKKASEPAVQIEARERVADPERFAKTVDLKRTIELSSRMTQLERVRSGVVSLLADILVVEGVDRQSAETLALSKVRKATIHDLRLLRRELGDFNNVVESASGFKSDTSPELVLDINGLGESLLDKTEERNLAFTIEAGLFAMQKLHKEEIADPELRRDLEYLAGLGIRAKERFVNANRGLAYNIAKKFVGKGLDYEDLAHEGIAGIIRAVEKFDYRKSYKFSTYATFWIRQAIERAVKDQGRTVRIPVYKLDMVNKMARITEELRMDLHREPTTAEIAKEMGMSVAEVTKVKNETQKTVSLYLQLGDDLELIDVLAERIAPELNIELQDDLSEAISRLSENEGEVIRALFFDGESVESLAVQKQITRQRVAQIRDKALEKLAELAPELGKYLESQHDAS